MKSFIAVAALAAVAVANPMAQAVSSSCSASMPGQYEITVVKPSTPSKRGLEERAACGGTGTLVVTLENGVMKDALGRTAYIASNNQFQFDNPPQVNALVTSGFSICSNNSIALGGSTVFYQCLSGSFYNLYNSNWAPQCSLVAMDVVACGGSSGVSATGLPVATQSSDGQPEGTSVLTQLSDAQPNGPSATTAAVLTQLSDAQPNGPSATVIAMSQYSDGQPQMPSALLSQLSDAQPVATGTAAANATVATAPPSVTPFTGAANLPMIGQMAAIAGGLAAVALL